MPRGDGDQEVMAICVTALLYGVFHRVLHVSWPANLLDQWRVAQAS